MEHYYNAYIIQEISYKGKKIPIGTIVVVRDMAVSDFGSGTPCILVGEEIDAKGISRSVWWGIEEWMITSIDWKQVK